MQTFHRLFKHASICAFILTLAPAAANAQGLIQEDGAAMDILPARTLTDDMVTVTNNDATHPAIRLTPDRSELVRLDTEAGTVVVGNPAHLSVLIDTSKTLVLVPKMPGATHFTVLDGKGNLIMQRHVIVASPKEHYVRVRRSCAGASGDCKDTSVYYCPDMCHQVAISETGQKGGGKSLEGKLKDISKDFTKAVDDGRDEQREESSSEGGEETGE